jgi:putative ABC transport system permease protein
MNRITPPRWADRFLAWYCNPDLLEEIQGDAHELYFERLATQGKRNADLKYIYDVLRFFRWSNIRGTTNESTPARAALWRFNFRIAARTAGRNKTIFVIKTAGLSLCLAFTLILTAYVINEITYDQFHEHYERIYRVTSKVDFQDRITHYAVTPLPLGQTMQEGIEEIERYTRFMYEGTPVYHVGTDMFYDEITLSADSNFFNFFAADFVHGDSRALNQPNKIALTESLAAKFFGIQDPIGRQVTAGGNLLLEVTAVIKDVPSNAHLRFDALISWATFQRDEDWGNLNAYTYVLLKPGVKVADVVYEMPRLLKTFHELVAREYKATYEPVFENIADIHFSEPLDEDIAEKRSETNVFILSALVFLFLITGLINYLNLTLAEITASLKKISIIRIFGGTAAGHNNVLLSDTLFALLMVAPVTALLCYFGWEACRTYFSIDIDRSVVSSNIFIGLAAGFFALLILSSRLNAFILSGAEKMLASLKGTLNTKAGGTRLRRMLVVVQLTFAVVMMAMILVVIDQFNFIRMSDKGFDDHNIVVVRLRGGEQATVEAFHEELRQLNGVAIVDQSSYYPGIIETKYVFQLQTEKGMTQSLVPMMVCGYDYFDALSIKISRGRSFDRAREDDRHHAYIINETAAREFGWSNPIGQKIDGPVHGDGSASREGEVIGVVRDFHFASLHAKIEPLIIFLTPEYWTNDYIYIRTDPVKPRDLITSIETTFRTHWPEVPFEWEYLDSKYLSLYRKDDEMKNIFEAGFVVSILVSGLGIFSISALVANLRAREMGIRKVAGAGAPALFFLHLKSFMHFLTLSVILAWPLIYYLSDGWLSNFAYHVALSAHHFLVPGVLSMVIILCTAGYHALRSARINPADVLKHE